MNTVQPTRVRHGPKIRGLTTLGVDEISYCKGRKFATLVYDLDRARVLLFSRVPCRFVVLGTARPLFSLVAT